MMEMGCEIAEKGSSPDRQKAAGCPALMNALDVGVVACLPDDDLTVLWGNACFYHGTGYSCGEFGRLFKSLRDFYAPFPDDFALVRHILAPVTETRDATGHVTVRLPKKGGKAAHVRFSWAPGNKDAGETAPVLLATLVDVTEGMAQKEELEEQARLSRQRLGYFHWMMDEFDGNVYVSDMDSYELLYLNRTACQTLGTTPKQVLGKKCYQVIQGRDSPCPFCTNPLLKEGETYSWEYANPVLKRTFMIRDRKIVWDGRQARLELSQDMTSTAYKLAKKDRERDALIGSMPGGFARLDARDMKTILWYSANFLTIIGYTPGQFESELHSECSYICEEDMARIVPALKKMDTSGQNLVVEARIRTRTGETKTLMITLCYASGADSWDGIPSFYTVGMDVTEERKEQARQHRALEEAYQAARIASEAKTNFLSSMSHDIRTPMNAIIGMAVIGQANLDVPEKIGDCLEKIRISSRHLLNLVNEILDMSKIESGKVDLASEEVSLPKLIGNVTNVCMPLVRARRQKFSIVTREVRHENLITDGTRLEQVFINLLSNAIKYTPEEGAVSVCIVELPSPVAGSSRFEFIFSDTGIGMSPEFMERIFEPFARDSNPEVSKVQGTGLGLAITNNIVRMMNGNIEVESVPGKGSRFVVTVPFEVRDDENAVCDQELFGRPVLVVDNDRVVCESAAELIDTLGMRGYWVQSGGEAVSRVMQAHRDRDDFFAVIVDWKMPGMDGLETVRAIRRQFGNGVPVIVISAYDFSDIEEDFRHAGADAFLTKPLFKSKILHVLQLFCRKPALGEHALSDEEKKGSDLSGKRVLLVEDNDLNREIAVELLGMHGISVDEAENGKQGLEMFSASAPGEYDCILMDIQMPEMDGYLATGMIRSLDRTDARTVPIIALTANALATDTGKVFHAGMNEHVTKPLDIGHLIDVIRTWTA